MPFLLEEARNKRGASTGVGASCQNTVVVCTGLVTEETWKRLQARLHLDCRCFVTSSLHRPSRAKVVRRLSGPSPAPCQCSAKHHLTSALVLWEPSSQLATASTCNVWKHITPWSRPIGRRRAFRRLQDCIPHTRVLTNFVTQTEAEPIQPGLKSWRQITHRPFGGSFMCRVQHKPPFAFYGAAFHVELTEQKRTIFDLSSDGPRFYLEHSEHLARQTSKLDCVSFQKTTSKTCFSILLQCHN